MNLWVRIPGISAVVTMRINLGIAPNLSKLFIDLYVKSDKNKKANLEG